MANDAPALNSDPLASPAGQSAQRAARRGRSVASLPRRPGVDSARGRGISGRLLLLAGLLAVAAVAAVVAVIVLVDRDQPPGEHSVDAGFARDMSVHHGQAVQMAIAAHDRTDNASLKILSLDIMLTQHGQYGIMQGWLDAWGLPGVGLDPPMTWMGDDAAEAMAAIPDKTGDNEVTAGMDAGHSMDGTMPGWASAEEVASLSTLPVDEMNREFLRLMIRHHQGGVLMAESAVDRAETPQIRDLAQAIINSQQMEITQMEELLAELS